MVSKAHTLSQPWFAYLLNGTKESLSHRVAGMSKGNNRWTEYTTLYKHTVMVVIGCYHFFWLFFFFFAGAAGAWGSEEKPLLPV